MKQISHWIDGRVVAGESGRVAPVNDPSRGEQTAEVDLASPKEVDNAVASAVAAAPGWSATGLSRRAEIIFRMRELLDGSRNKLASLISAEHGKVAADADGEVARGLENLEFACGVPHLLKGSYSAHVSPGIDVHSVLHPIGVAAGITPFNFPAMVPLWMMANAIACGNCFLLKPSERDPSASLFLADLWQGAGLPDGVFNVVQGDRVAVDRLLEHPLVGAISFVGSTSVARRVYEVGCRNGKRVQALGGAKNHMVVLPDADIDVAAGAAVSAAYGSAGERCMAVSVVVAVGSVADSLVDAICQRILEIVVGRSDDPASMLGPLITAEHVQRVGGYLEPESLGAAKVVVDGRLVGADRSGFFLGPTLVDHVAPGSRIYDEEIFGPVLSVVRVESYEDAVSLINSSAYANGAAIFTRDGGAARRFEADAEVGMIGVNVPIPVPVSHFSFGGWKASLFGDARMYGPDGIRFYTREKVVTSRWPEPSVSAIELGFPQHR